MSLLKFIEMLIYLIRISNEIIKVQKICDSGGVMVLSMLLS